LGARWGRDAIFGRRLGEVDEDGVALEPHRVDPHRIAADLRLTAGQIELPVVPVAGQHAVRAERAFAERVAFVRAAVGDGVYTARGGDQQDLLAGLAHHLAATALQLGAADGDGFEPGFHGAAAPSFHKARALENTRRLI